MVALVIMDNDVAEPCGGEDGAEFVGGVGVHTVNEFFPFLIIACEAVVLVDNDEMPTIPIMMILRLKTYGIIHGSTILGQKDKKVEPYGNARLSE